MLIVVSECYLRLFGGAVINLVGTYLCIKKASEFSRPGRMFQLAQRFGLYLSYAFTCHGELLADLLKGMVSIHSNAKPHAKDAFFTRRKGRQNAGGGFA